MSPWQHRTDANFPYQRWQPFPDEAIVEVANVHGEKSIGPARNFWWGYEQHNPEGTITRARSLDYKVARRTLTSREEIARDIIAAACNCDKSCRRGECACLHVARAIMQSERLACASLLEEMADKPTAHVVAIMKDIRP
ncbi:MAG: hypothetical protein AB7U75_14720 [Hyphomicrobiaceae bacterium]